MAQLRHAILRKPGDGFNIRHRKESDADSGGHLLLAQPVHFAGLVRRVAGAWSVHRPEHRDLASAAVDHAAETSHAPRGTARTVGLS